jgi:HSP20 family molecular chaperone IbpA
MRNGIFENLFGFDYTWPYRNYYRNWPERRLFLSPDTWQEKRVVSTKSDNIENQNYFDQVFRDFDQIFGSSFSRSKFFGAFEQKRTDLELSITVTVPGVDPSEVSLTVETNGTNTSILRLKFQENEKTWQIQAEAYDLEKISCSVKNGIITVLIPAVEKTQALATTRNITVNS